LTQNNHGAASEPCMIIFFKFGWTILYPC